MFGSQINNKEVVLAIYQDPRTVFRLIDIAMLTGETRFGALNKKLNYHVRTGKLLNPRKGIYAKPSYNREELACSLFTPSYISLEYVLQKTGVVFQYDSGITVISYLSRNIEVENQNYRFRKIKGELLINTSGIKRDDNQVNIATPERALLDKLYLDGESYFDNLNSLKKELVFGLLPVYHSKKLTERVTNLFKND